MFSRKIFSERLRLLRKEHNELQKDLADLLEVSQSQITEMERGHKGTSLERLVILCEHYNVSADYLLGLTEERRALTMEEETEVL